MVWFIGVRILEYKDRSIINVLKRPYSTSNLESKVKGIIREVLVGGDKALVDYLERFHRVRGRPLKVEEWEVEEAYKRVGEKAVETIKLLYNKAATVAERLKPPSVTIDTWPGVRVIVEYKPVKRVGIYVPAGNASYPSTVIMTVSAARAAGVDELYLSSPPRSDGGIDPYILVAADIGGVNAVYRLGGAYAAAAMAIGTESVEKVDMIAGPGGAWFTTAKRLLSEYVGVDFIAGPTELLIIADGSVDAEWVAWDIAAQAEHSEDTFIVLASTSRDYVRSVLDWLEYIVDKVDRGSVIANALSNGGYAVIVNDVMEAVEIADVIAPEHVYVASSKPEAPLIARQIRNAGSISVGPYSPPALSDYSTGSNHVLPTGGWARVRGGLTPLDFLKPVYINLSSGRGFKEACFPAFFMARVEGLSSHAYSLKVRGCSVDG
ncbi:MAG: histidinol dehydrogenase [Desulfurococcales archaeon]|nr:histidinol dehydrogenase [Desulfurococcales archaeon]